MGREESVMRVTGILFVVAVLTGCAGLPERPADIPTATFSSDPKPIEMTLSEPVLTFAGAETSREASAPGASAPSESRIEKPTTSNAPANEAPAEEEFYDPFQKEGDQVQVMEEYDPWEPFNVVMFTFNRKVDKYVLKPVAKVYDKVMPDRLELGISNAVHNIRFVPRFLNNLLQGKFKGAGIELSRFVINSTLGIAGFYDFAKHQFGLVTPDEDTGQTLAVYGVKPGPYLVLPFLPPLTLRDAFGLVGDTVMEPMNYFIFSVIRVGQPALVTHQTTATLAVTGERTGEIVNERSINIEKFQGVEEATLDLYSAVRNAYLQTRARMIRE